MEKKKITNGQLQNRLRNAILHIDKTKDTQSVFFDDKGLRLTVNEDFAIISTMFHRHVFGAITAQGASRPYLYTRRFIEIALENDCSVKDEHGHVTRSYGKLLAMLSEKENQEEYRIAWYYDLWLNNIFHPLYGIGESETEAFLVYESYMHTIARNKIILSEKVDDITNKQFVAEVGKSLNDFMENVDERVIFHKKTDEEKKQEESDALREAFIEKSINSQGEEKKNDE